jgi:hypothetical protein
MLTKTLFAAGLLAATTTMAFAEPPRHHGKPHHMGSDMDRSDGGMDRWDRGDRGKDRGDRWGRQGRHSGEGMEKGFNLRLGHGVRLRINCGDDSMKDCLDAARPLIDQVMQHGVSNIPAPPPPPHRDSQTPPSGLPHADGTPPAPGASDMPAPPLPPGETVPPTPPAN